MGSERGNYVMSVELAMQREMAYRHKLECLQRGRNKDPLLSQSQTSSQAPSPLPTLGFFPYPKPHPHFGPEPGQVSPLRPNTWYRGPTHGLVRLVRPPLPGSHSRPSLPSGPTYSADHKRKLPLKKDNFLCHLCEVDCTTAVNYSMHLKGKKHKANLEGGTQTRAAGGTKAKEMISCELCGILCSNEHIFKQHLSSRNHYYKLHFRDIKLKGLVGGSALP